MVQLDGLFSRPSGTSAAIAGVATATVLLGIYLRVRPALVELRPLPVNRHIIHARTRDAAASPAEKAADGTEAPPLPPYRLDEFPGARQLRTSYGTMQIFEWGPEEGEKVLLLHGIGTPCIALGDMAREFVAKGCRVMLFGRCSDQQQKEVKECSVLTTNDRSVWKRILGCAV